MRDLYIKWSVVSFIMVYTVRMPPKKAPILTIAQSNKSAIPRPLQFYDPELQEAWNAEPADPERVHRACARARELHASYIKSIRTFASRMSKETYRKFSDPDQLLFDSDLLEFAFGDSIGGLANPRRRRLSLTVKAVFRSYNERTLHTLTYKRVASMNANVPAERWFDWGDGVGRVDHLLADELTDGSGTEMQHTFLFASGAVITIQFGAVTWKSNRLR